MSAWRQPYGHFRGMDVLFKGILGHGVTKKGHGVLTCQICLGETLLRHYDLETTFTDLFPHHENPTPLYNRNMTTMSFIYYSDSSCNDIGS